MLIHRYWGKTQKAVGDRTMPAYHLLAYHALDVAACAMALVRAVPRYRRVLPRLLGLTLDETVALIGWVAALHDLGKLCPPFQRQDAATAAVADLLWGPPSTHAYEVRHDILGWCLWRDISAAGVEGLSEDVMEQADIMMQTATGHHGRPVAAYQNGRVIDMRQYIGEPGLNAAAEWVTWVSKRFRPTFATEDALQRASWLVAGIITLADWLGSNTEYFKFKADEIDVERYFQKVAIPAAKHAVAASGVAAVQAKREYHEIFPEYAPTPVQSAVLGLPNEQPFCLVIEETTGGGKTEAALAAAGGREFYFGLPTQATANGLWNRLGSLGGQQTLIHGGRWMLPESMDRATAWLNDNGRVALLASLGVGTVDQAMLAALPAKYGALRYAGLAGKTLIIDEVHAYDVYMRQILEVLVEMHARAEGSVVLLSATLPLSHRAGYLQAWCRGRGLPAPTLKATGFPLISHVDHAGTVREIDGLASRYEGAGARGRTVSVSHATNTSSVESELLSRARDGQCGVWIRNTVGEAIDSYISLKKQGADVLLFHSRFTAGDRARIEQEVLRVFGKASTSEERAPGGVGRILVATQVVEQSLDIDFDFLVTDLCPVDLLLQRAGRLHRHTRGDRGVPTMLVYAPASTDTPPDDWVSNWSRGTAFVYSDHGKLWLTQRLVGNGFTLPADSRMLVEGVYGENTEPLPPGLLANSEKELGKQLAQETHGGMSALNPRMGYQPDGIRTWDDRIAATRLADASDEYVVCNNGIPVSGGIAESTMRVRKAAFSQAPEICGMSVGPYRKTLALTHGTAVCFRYSKPATVTYDPTIGLQVDVS